MLGILGVGHLSASLIAGIMRAGWPHPVLLAPRGRSAEMAARHGLDIARDNADLVARSRIVLLAVRPADAAQAVAGLPWRADQVLVSACAGVPAAALSAAHPARVQRIMPVTAAEIGASPTACFPDLPETRALLATLGPVVPLAREADFQIATVSAAIYGWVQDLVRISADWSAAQGLDPVLARRLNALTFVAAGQLIADRPEPMADLLRDLVTPGGITERGLQVLSERGAPGAWTAACDAVLQKLDQPAKPPA